MLIELLVGAQYFLLFLIFFGIFRNWKFLSFGIFWYNKMEKFMEIFPNLTSEIPKKEDLSKRNFLIDIINQGKADKLPGKTPWTVCRIKSATDAVIEKLHTDYTQAEIKRRAKNTGEAVFKHTANLYSKSIAQFIKISNVKRLCNDIENDPIIKDSMSDLGGLMVGTFGRFLAPLLVIAHTLNHSDGFIKDEKEEVVPEVDT